ncbi:HAD family hydrolase [Polymorphospora sp. 2-325]|uniref:HAD family hydrolase n=1 Tax=Polymorphospora lycopeni TaxID=3140240 RepID=A0ABV5CV60_9ACTN
MTAELPYRIVATDLDGTLLRSDRTFSARTLRTLAAVRAGGARHVVVTGRPVYGTRRLLTQLDYRGLAICGQGAQVYDFDADRLLLTRTLDREVARALVQAISRETGTLALAAVAAEGFLATADFDRRPGADWRLVTEADLWAGPVEKILIRHPGHDDEALVAVAQRICGPALTVAHAGARLVELLPAGISKATGLVYAARRWGLTAADTIAFGDMPNDIPMLDWAGYGVAMANGHRSLRERADETTLTNDEDGVAVVLERLLATGSAPARNEQT